MTAKSALGLKKLYVIPINFGENDLGSLQIATRKNSPAIDHSLIESLMAVVASVLNRQYAEQKLEEQNEMSEKLLSIIGHDLKSPISSIYSYSSLFLDRQEDSKPADFMNFAKAINTSAMNGITILDGLLRWSKDIKSKSLFNPNNFQLTNVVNDAIEQVESLATRKAIRISNLVDVECFLFADQKMILTIVRNLIANSIKFSVPICARVATPEATIKESIATGPTANWREVPKTAYTICGIIAVYKP